MSDTAEGILKRELEQYPEDPNLHYQLATVLMSSFPRWPDNRRMRKSFEHVEISLAVDPSNAATHALRAYVNIQLEEFGEGVLAARRAVRLKEGDETYENLLLEALDWSGNPGALVRLMRKLAAKRGIDLTAVRKELKEIGFPSDPLTVLQNAFPGGAVGYRRTLGDEIARIESRHEKGNASDVDLARAARGENQAACTAHSQRSAMAPAFRQAMGGV